MRLPALILLVLPACAATAEGQWPSLARRPGEAESASPAVAAPAEPLPVASGDASAAAVASGRVAEVARELEQLNARWQRQRDDTEAAVTAARGAAASSQPWARAQLELTRFERLGAEMLELRDRLDAIAGDLALASAQGGEVKAVLDQAGQLILQLEAGRAEHLRRFQSAQQGLAK